MEAFGPDDAADLRRDSRSTGARCTIRTSSTGVTIEYWNGIPFDRAVDLHAESETGGRPDARRARALESLTFRALDYAPPPERGVGGARLPRPQGRRRAKCGCIGKVRSRARRRRPVGRSATRIRRAINPAAEAMRRAKKFRFNHRPVDGRACSVATRASWRRSRIRRLPDRAHGQDHASGTFGYLRIWSFDVDDDQAFLDAAIALLRDCRERGLIIDLRDNPGGFIWAAERLLQFFTPNPVTPTKFALRATPLTSAMARAAFNQSELAPWAESLFTAEADRRALFEPPADHALRAVQRPWSAVRRTGGGGGGRQHLFLRRSLHRRHRRQSHRPGASASVKRPVPAARMSGTRTTCAPPSRPPSAAAPSCPRA